MMPTARPCAYIRRSVARTGDPGDVSRQFQTDKVRSLANGDGPTLRIIDGDWGRSAAGEKTDKRLAFLGLLAAVERGEVSTLYAYSTDRLARSVRWSAQLLDACEVAGTTIVTSEGRFAPGDDMARQMFHFQAMQNEGALRQMTTKSTAVAGKRKERGDRMGRAPYGYKHAMIDGVSTLVPREGEDPAHVVAVFEREGSYLAAARALNAEGYPTRFAGSSWDPTTVRHVVKRERPALVPVRSRRGSRTRSVRIFGGLLVCRCGKVLTSATPKWGVQYYCHDGHVGKHPNPYMVAESKVLAWAKREVAKLGGRLKTELKGKAPSPEARVAGLEAKRERVRGLAIAGVIDPVRAKQELAAIDAEMPALETRGRAIRSFRLEPAFIWGRDAADMNAELRTIWDRIELGPDMLPARAVWTIGQSPEERDEREAAFQAAERHGEV